MDPLDAAQALAALLGPIGGFLVGLRASTRGDHIVKELAELSSIRSEIGEPQRPALDTLIAFQLDNLLDRRRYRLNRQYVFYIVFTMITLGIGSASLFFLAPHLPPPWSTIALVVASVFVGVIFYDLATLIRHRYLAPMTHPHPPASVGPPRCDGRDAPGEASGS